jgi:putative addiction module component (TIGR02574 family)
MSNETMEILKKALTLSVEERADLANSLLESMDDATDPSVEAAWQAEIVRRMEEIDSGKVKPVSLAEARPLVPRTESGNSGTIRGGSEPSPRQNS